MAHHSVSLSKVESLSLDPGVKMGTSKHNARSNLAQAMHEHRFQGEEKYSKSML